ncbi:MAG: efflux RND transporter periplasmic adaptor subunit [Opitutales bacterium]
MILMLVAVLVLLGGIFGWWAYKGIKMGKAMAAQKPPPVTVSATVARGEAWQPKLHAVGTLVAVHGVVVTNELAGTIDRIGFESGQRVKPGDLLVSLDTSTDEAQLRSLKASMELARLTLARARQLAESNANAKADLDNAQAQYDQAVAGADVVRATIAKKKLHAPFPGRLGIRLVNLGQFLAVGTPVVSLEELNPIYVNFTLPQQAVREVSVGQAVTVKIDTFPRETFAGSITAIAPRLDDATRSVQMQATLENSAEKLRPGMFGGVDVLMPAKENVITVPQTAITYNPYGDVIFVIDQAKDAQGHPLKDDKGEPVLVVRQQFVKVGETRGDQVAILDGVKAGEEVVTAGQLKLRNGVNIRVDNSVPVADSPTPTPPNT